ncbi:hypothetical protein [Tengunoibacter tsumagoiensis]|uniref:Uncharacterized protein n=1 Tax=Tengunoibacter tsumagoiensis TaxID=2014871 RepID=A0A402A645_9CHLR|nr:hypothetical protein [Tengunoibacter tsumagoiensis]GCE14461.1 hypothetical protein KTT_43200 [Tengunoibacter tsumagoiensis]
MPKEAKKFINPLLRPSHDPEARTEKIIQTEKNNEAEKAALDVERPRSREQVVEQPIIAQPEPPVEAVVEEIIQRKEDQAPPTLLVDTPAPYTVKKQMQETTFLEERPYSLPESGEQVVPSKSRPTYRATPRQTAKGAGPVQESTPKKSSGKEVASISAPLAEEPHSTENFQAIVEEKTNPLVTVNQEEEDNGSDTSRRKRGAATFENTHERVTLWIDKSLKQSFDDLAYEHHLSKASLLNEAISDLLLKYDR